MRVCAHCSCNDGYVKRDNKGEKLEAILLPRTIHAAITTLV